MKRLTSKQSLLIGLMAAVASLLSSCSSGSPPAKETSQTPATSQSSQPAQTAQTAPAVLIQGFKFQPADLTVKVGDSVQFTNSDIVPHNAVSAGKFDSGKLQKGQSWKYVAKEKGTFDYLCTLHPNMKGRITIR
jgi:plastocyanin